MDNSSVKDLRTITYSEEIGYKIITAGEFLIRHQGNLEALANYLPYNLKFVENNDKNEVDATYYKPLFRPLSELFNGNYEDILGEFQKKPHLVY